jgi:hypothetical protein
MILTWLRFLQIYTPSRRQVTSALTSWVAFTSIFWILYAPGAIAYVWLNMLGSNANLWVSQDWLGTFFTSLQQATLYSFAELSLAAI